MTTATAPVEVDWDRVIAQSADDEKAADARAVELRAQQRDLMRRSVRGENVASALGKVDVALDRAAKDAKHAKLRREAALLEQKEAGQRAQAESRSRVKTELVDLKKQRHRHLGDIEALLLKLQAELMSLRELEVQVLQRRSALGQGMGIDIRRLVSDRLSWLLGRGCGPGGLGDLAPLTSKGQARRPLTEVFAPADVAAEDGR